MGCYLIAWNMKTEGKTVIVKFCGGCNPKYDRVAYWEEIKTRAGDAVTWVAADFPRPDGMLLICGCHSVCPLKHYNQADYGFYPGGQRPEESRVCCR